MPEPPIEPENRTKCLRTNGKHEWVWDEDHDDWFCDACGVWHEGQEDQVNEEE